MKKKSISLLISGVFLVFAFILGTWLIESTTTYITAKEQLAQQLSYQNRFLNGEEWTPIETQNTKGFKYNEGKIDIHLSFASSSQQQEHYQTLETTILNAEHLIYSRATILLLCIIVYLVIMSCLFIYNKPPFCGLIGLLSLSIICLYVGLFCPMLEIGAIEHNLDLGKIPIQKEILGFMVDLTIEKKFEGDIYFYYQSKSIAQLILLLFKQHNFVVGFSILIFSVVFPLLKTFLMIWFVFKPDISTKKWFKNIVLNLSKWSMADVFVVAIFLGFLAFKNLQAGVGTYSHVSIGLYFFFAYCMFSMISSTFAKMPTEEFS